MSLSLRGALLLYNHLAAPAAATGDIVINDAFTGTNGTELAAYNADWSDVTVGNTDKIEIQSNAASYKVGDFGFAEYEHSAAPVSNEYDIRADITLSGVNGAVSLLARADGDVWNGAPGGGADAFDASFGTTFCTLYSIVNGAFTTLGEYTFASDLAYSVEFRVRDGVKAVFKDGVPVILRVDNQVTQVGKVHIVLWGDLGGDSTLDNLVVQDVDAVGGATRYRAIIG